MSDNSQSILENIGAAARVVILLPAEPKFETVAAGLSIYLALKNGGKNADIACPTPMIVEMNRLVGVDQVKTQLSGRNLVISFDYVKDAIEKVSYNVEDGKFNLVIQPKQGHRPLSADKVAYSFSGAGSDAVILVGTTDEGVLKAVSADKESGEGQIFSLMANEAKSLTSEAAALIGQLGLTMDKDTAGNLYQGLVRETEQFMNVKAAEFETAAYLVKAGAAPQEVLINQPKEEKKPMEAVGSTEASDEGKAWLAKPRIFRSGGNE